MVMEHKGTQYTIGLDFLSCTAGTVNSNECKAFYINLGGWIDVSDIEDKITAVRRFKTRLEHYIRAISADIHSDHLYTFVDMDLPVNLGQTVTTGFFGIETTIMLKEPIKNFKTDTFLESNLKSFGELVQYKIQEFSDIKVTKRRMSSIAA